MKMLRGYLGSLNLCEVGSSIDYHFLHKKVEKLELDLLFFIASDTDRHKHFVK